jgi:adenylate kinase
MPKPTNAKPLMIVLLGAPGAGKGTQATGIVREFGVVHVSTGDMFRDNIKNETPIGKKAKQFIDAGQLVPDDVVIEMLKERIQKPDCEKGVLLDGFPRTQAQAVALDKLIGDKYKLIAVSLEISDKTVLERITGRRYCPICNRLYHVTFAPPKEDMLCDTCHKPLATRNDDTEKTVRDRLAIFHQQSGPVKEFYAKKKVLFDINADRDSHDVAKECIDLIHSQAK